MKWITRERPKTVLQLAVIVRGADRSRLDLAPQSPGYSAQAAAPFGASRCSA
ncbi:MAG: hypothetical protein LH632_00395 [Rhodoferax sp.]|nr:hypothetical protein [Rhodoferax sp.]